MASTEVVSGVSGETEQKIRLLFEKAVEASPCVLLLDEIDAIAPKRENAQREMERRIVSQLVSCLDGSLRFCYTGFKIRFFLLFLSFLSIDFCSQKC